MGEMGSFASLSPTLLARKGKARPAMRPQLQPIQLKDSAFQNWENDLGWNDMGLGDDDDFEAATGGEVVSFDPAVALNALKGEAGAFPEVLRQQAAIANRITQQKPVRAAAGKPAPAAEPVERRSALADGRRAAFTLRLDGDRHLQLRLACAASNRSAQQLVTEALDKLIGAMPEIDELTATLKKQR